MNEPSHSRGSGRRVRWTVGLSLLAPIVVLAVVIVSQRHDPYMPPQDPLSAGLSKASTPGGEPLTVVEQGFTAFAEDRALSYGFVLANSSGLLAQEVRVDVQALDRDGLPVSDVSWTAIVKRVPAGAAVGHGGTVRLRLADAAIDDVAGLDIEVRDTQAWWADDGSVAAELTTSAADPVLGPLVEDGEQSVEFTLSKTGVAQYRADLNLVFRDGSGLVVGGCSKAADVERPSERMMVLCRIPDGADVAATEIYTDAHWTIPILPYPYPPES